MASSVATSHRPLIDMAIPAEGTMRWVAYALLAIAGSLVLWVSAKFQIPFYPVPMSLQTLVVMLIGGLYGWRLGLATVVLYLAEGALGLPVFANTPERGIGLAYMMGPTGGFLVGFAVAAGFIGWFVERGFGRSPLSLAPIMLAGDVILFVIGFAWLASLIGIEGAWTFGVVPFVLGDLVKVAIATLAIPAAARLLER